MTFLSGIYCSQTLQVQLHVVSKSICYSRHEYARSTPQLACHSISPHGVSAWDAYIKVIVHAHQHVDDASTLHIPSEYVKISMVHNTFK